MRAAQELPRSRRELDDIVARAVADEAFRKALIDDLDRALRDVGYEPEALPLDELRRRLVGRLGLGSRLWRGRDPPTWVAEKLHRGARIRLRLSDQEG